MPMTLEATYRIFRSSLYIVHKQYLEVQQNAWTYQPLVSIEMMIDSGLIGFTITVNPPEPDGGICVAA
jgi:hypothetical protein